MDANTYLMQIRLLNAKIKTKMEELSQMRSMAESVKAVRYDREPVQSQHASDPLNDAVIRIIESEHEIDALIDELVDKKSEVMGIIEHLTVPEEYEVIHKYYVLEMSWKEISEKMKYSYTGIMKIRKNALQKLTVYISE